MSEQREWQRGEKGSPGDFFWYAVPDNRFVITCAKEICQDKFAHVPAVCVETLFFTDPLQNKVFPFAPMDTSLDTLAHFVNFITLTTQRMSRYVSRQDRSKVIQQLTDSIGLLYPVSLGTVTSQARAYVRDDAGSLLKLIADLKDHVNGKTPDIYCLRQPASGIGMGYTRGTDGLIRDAQGKVVTGQAIAMPSQAIGGTFEIRDSNGRVLHTGQAPIAFNGPVNITAENAAEILSGQSNPLQRPLAYYGQAIGRSHGMPSYESGQHTTNKKQNKEVKIDPPKNPKRKFR